MLVGQSRLTETQSILATACINYTHASNDIVMVVVVVGEGDLVLFLVGENYLQQ